MCSVSMWPLRVKTVNPCCADVSILKVMAMQWLPAGTIRQSLCPCPRYACLTVQRGGQWQMTENKREGRMTSDGKLENPIFREIKQPRIATGTFISRFSAF